MGANIDREITPAMIAAGVESMENELETMEITIPRLLLEILVERCVRASLAEADHECA